MEIKENILKKVIIKILSMMTDEQLKQLNTWVEEENIKIETFKQQLLYYNSMENEYEEIEDEEEEFLELKDYINQNHF